MANYCFITKFVGELIMLNVDKETRYISFFWISAWTNPSKALHITFILIDENPPIVHTTLNYICVLLLSITLYVSNKSTIIQNGTGILDHFNQDRMSEFCVWIKRTLSFSIISKIKINSTIGIILLLFLTPAPLWSCTQNTNF